MTLKCIECLEQEIYTSQENFTQTFSRSVCSLTIIERLSLISLFRVESPGAALIPGESATKRQEKGNVHTIEITEG